MANHRPRTPSVLAPARSALRRARRSPVPWWTAGAALAALTAGQVHAIGREAEAARDAWGRPVDVVVVVEPVAAGAVVGTDDVRVGVWPDAVVPEGALSEPPVGRVAIAPLVRGEAVVEERVAPDGVRGPAALLAEGHRAVAVPTGPGTPPLVVGDRVDVVATDAAAVVATGALVVDVGDDAVTVGVPAADAPAAAAAAAAGAAVLALVGP